MTASRANVAANVRTLMDRDPQLSTQRAVQDAAGVEQSTISKLLAGKQSPRLEVVDALAQAFGVETWHLLLAPEHFATVSVGTERGALHHG